MKRLSSLLLLFVLVISPLAVFAQDGEDMQTYTSEDGLLTVEYPADWVAQVFDDNLPVPHVALSTESAAEKLDSDEPPAAGDAAIIVMLFPAEFIAMMAGGDPDAPVLSEESTAVELADFFGWFFAEDEDMEATPEPEMTEESESEEVELTDELTAGMADVSGETQDAKLIVFEASEGVYTVVWAIAYPGEFSDEFQQLAQDVAATVTYTGTADDIMNAMMGVEGTEEGDTSSTLDGDALVSERCTVCHSRDRIDAEDTDEEGWTAIVDRMIGYGAQLNADERAAVIQYLVETH